MYPNDIEQVVVVEDGKDSQRSSLSIPLLGTLEPEDIDKGKTKTKAALDKAKRYLRAHLSKAVIGVVWLLLNLFFFVQHFILYYFFKDVNVYVGIAKGFGQMLNFNSALILFPVLRNVITTLRQTVLHRFIPFDSNIMFHRRIAWMILFASYGHGIAHYINYSLQDSPLTLAWTTLAGVTGNLIVFVIVVIYTSAIDSIRRRYFNVFYFAHHLFVIFYLLLLFHGPNFWLWFLLPGTIYIIERIVREIRAKIACTVLEVTNHPSDVIEIRMSKKHFKYKAGQYLYLNAPHLSVYEWHPFTITSAPHEDFVSVHIRAVGKWTKGIRGLLAPESEGTVALNKKKAPDGRPLVRLDGPFGAASEEVFDFKVVLLVGAGIGVTPYASILKAINHRKKTNQKCKIEKAYFFWICRETRAFEWFEGLLKDLENDQVESSSDLLDFNMYLTQRYSEDQLEEFKADQQANEFDPITGLRSKTHFGRPDFDVIFDKIRDEHPNTKVGVFFCGPRVLSKDLRALAMAKSSKHKTDGARFVFHKENF